MSRRLLVTLVVALALLAVSATGAWAAGPTAYVANSADKTVTPLNVATNAAGTAIPVGSEPSAVAITPDGTTAYVTNSLDNTVTPINLATNTPGAAIPVGNGPVGVAITPDGTTAYVTNTLDNNVTPINLATNTPGAAIPVGADPIGVAITPDGKTAYVADGRGTITPIDVATDTAGTPIPIGGLPAFVAITPDGRTAYVTETSGGVVPIDLATNTPGAPIPVGSNPHGIAITPDGKTAYVADAGDSTVTPIDLATNTPGAAIPVGSRPSGVAITLDGRTAYVSDAGDNTVTPIDVATNTPGHPIPVGGSPAGVAITPVPVHDQTQTSLSCSPATVALGESTTCAAQVADANTTPSTPSGSVSFTSDSSGSLGSGGSCTLQDGSCSLTYTPGGAGASKITADYEGDGTHQASASMTTVSAIAAPSVTVTTPTNAATYTQGQVVDANYSCGEAAGGPGLESGSAGCSGTVSNGSAINTSALGPQTFAVTATSSDGQSTTQTVDYTVVAAGTGADVSATISGPTHAADNTTFSETITIANVGPAAATNVVTGVVIPPGVTVSSAGGGSKLGPAVYWTAKSIAAHSKVTYTLSLKVSANARGIVPLAVATASTQVKDPAYTNNAALTTVALGSSTGSTNKSTGPRSGFGKLTLPRLEHHTLGRQ